MEFTEINKHNLEYLNNMNHIKMLKQHYDDIPRYINQSSGDKHPQIDTNIPIQKISCHYRKYK